jgi:hypothetical protein
VTEAILPSERQSVSTRLHGTASQKDIHSLEYVKCHIVFKVRAIIMMQLRVNKFMVSGHQAITILKSYSSISSSI